MKEPEKKKKGLPEEQKDRGQKITAAGGSAINTAVFVQNSTQVLYKYNTKRI